MKDSNEQKRTPSNLGTFVLLDGSATGQFLAEAFRRIGYGVYDPLKQKSHPSLRRTRQHGRGMSELHGSSWADSLVLDGSEE